MKFIKQNIYIFLAFFIFCLIFFVGSSSAAIINVSPGTGTIQSAVSGADDGDTLNLSAGIYNDHEVMLDKNLTIQGPSVASGTTPTARVNGQNIGRIFFVNPDVTVTLKYLLLENGYTDEAGGAVSNPGNLIINSCTFTGNNAESGGGAIENEVTGTCTITDSTFITNHAPSNDGGAIYNYFGSLSINKCTFNSNTASDKGGAIYNYNGTCSVTNSTFNSNTANDGGAIYNDGEDGNCTVTCSTFNLNHVGNNGGAIQNTAGNFTVLSVTFNNNIAYADGGAIFNGNPNIYEYGGTLIVSGSTFSNNSATSNSGGAISTGLGNCTVTSSMFSGNTATGNDGGAINNFGGNCTVSDCIFNINSAIRNGGAICIIYGNSTVSNCTFNSNSATYDGGAIYNYGVCTVSNSTFISNKVTTQASDRSGNAIYSEGFCTVTGSLFNNNNGTGQGTIYIQNNSGPGPIIINYNAFCNTCDDVYCHSGSVDAKYNWWGVHLTPHAWGDVSANIDDSRWLVLTINATPSTIKKNGKANITADLNHDNTGAIVAGHVIDGIPITFTTTLGTINSPVSTVNGAATATLNSGTKAGIARVFAKVHTQSVNTTVTFDITSPTARAGSPARNAVNVPIDTVISTTFTEPVKAGNINIELRSSSGAVPFTTTITGNVLTVTPTIPLTKATKYTLILHTGSITDIAGNPIALYSRSFTTDSTAPAAKAGSPARDAVNVPIDSIITTTFTEPIKAGNMNIELRSSSGAVPFTTTITGNVLTVTPTIPLVKATKYTLILHTGSITDIAGNRIALYSRSFTTDSTASKVVAGNPARNAVNVPIDTLITTTFSEPIKEGNMNIQLVGGGTSVPFTTSISGNVLTVTPTTFLTAGNVKYTLTLQAGSITDLAGNPIVLYSRPFTTVPAF